MSGEGNSSIGAKVSAIRGGNDKEREGGRGLEREALAAYQGFRGGFEQDEDGPSGETKVTSRRRGTDTTGKRRASAMMTRA